MAAALLRAGAPDKLISKNLQNAKNLQHIEKMVIQFALQLGSHLVCKPVLNLYSLNQFTLSHRLTGGLFHV